MRDAIFMNELDVGKYITNVDLVRFIKLILKKNLYLYR